MEFGGAYQIDSNKYVLGFFAREYTSKDLF